MQEEFQSQEQRYETRQVNLNGRIFEASCRIGGETFHVGRGRCTKCRRYGRNTFAKRLLEARNITCASTLSPVGDRFPLARRVILGLKQTSEFRQGRCRECIESAALVAV